MKHCPVCDSICSDSEQFCERDGARLVPDSPETRAEYLNHRDSSGWQDWNIVAIVAVAGIGIGMVLLIGYLQIARESNDSNSNQSSNSLAQQQIPFVNPWPTALPSVSPSAEPSPSPSPDTSPSAQANDTRVALSSSPVSTGRDEKLTSGSIRIRLTNGTTVEADEVWETGEGIWYRHRGVVSLLERNQVVAIARATPAVSPSATASPSASP